MPEAYPTERGFTLPLVDPHVDGYPQLGNWALCRLTGWS
jgi:hypothetical protein